MEISRRPMHNANASFDFAPIAPEFSTQETPSRFAGGMGNSQFQQQIHETLCHLHQKKPQMYHQVVGNNMHNDGQQYMFMSSRDAIDGLNELRLRDQARSSLYAPQQHTQALSDHHVAQRHTEAMSGHPVQPQYIQTMSSHPFQQQPQALSGHPSKQQPQAYNSYAGNNMNNFDQYQQMAGRDAEYMGSSHTQQQQSQMYNHARNNISDMAKQHQGTVVGYAGGLRNHHSNQYGGMVSSDANGTNHNQLRGQPQGMTDRLSQRQDTTGNMAPTHAHGYPPFQPVYGSNEFEPGRQYAMLPDSKNCAQPPSMSYLNTERGTVSGPQNPTATLTNFGAQMAQSNKEQDIERHPESVDLTAHVRRDQKNFSLKTTTPAVTTTAFPTVMPTQFPAWNLQTQVHPPAMPTQFPPRNMPTQIHSQAMPAQFHPRNMPGPAPLFTAKGPVTNKRLRYLQTEKMEPRKVQKNANGAGKGRRRGGQDTPVIQPVVEPMVATMVDLMSRSTAAKFAGHGYDINVSNLAPGNSSIDIQTIPEEDRELFEILNIELGELQPSGDFVVAVMGELLENSIAHFSLDISSDTRRNLEYYQKMPNLGYHVGNLTKFAPRSQFVNPPVVEGPSKSKKKLETDPTSIILYEPIKGSFYGRSMMGNCTMYTRTIFDDVNRPLRYAVGFKIENVMIDGRNAQGMLTYERALPTDIQGEPCWSDICDLLQSQLAEWAYASLDYN
ncbi:hypothetical protein sscle_01g004860 [Sclerotinia sclerotiorum 1980 UF-70]|uniref:Uncharacterized protein n=1 Tax=Sclerotinia sclerotiorum (strain ATCC 18683 / 1980 / Ss-1) TaxID=665079 RepID=A0A1D9PST4_SCLS1|nr:hypothetical protein sscle_01g004860 [Sclerotinia sclerotiorum 1980 UF-70]